MTWSPPDRSNSITPEPVVRATWTSPEVIAGATSALVCSGTASTSSPYFLNSPWSRATQIGSVSALMKAWATLILRGALALAAAELDPPAGAAAPDPLAGAAAPELPGAALLAVGVLALPAQPASITSTSRPPRRPTRRPSQPPRRGGDATIVPYTAPPGTRHTPNRAKQRRALPRTIQTWTACTVIVHRARVACLATRVWRGSQPIPVAA